MTEPTTLGKTMTITIDGQEHELATLSENAKAQLVNLRVTDSEIERIKATLAIFQTARMAYAKTLKDELDKKTQAH